MKLLAALFGAFLLTTSPSLAAEYHYEINDEIVTVYITGMIMPGEAMKFLSWYKATAVDSETAPHRIVLNSGGGSLFDGMEFAKIIEANKIETVVPHGATCASICVNIWAAGEIRVVSRRSRIGVHQASMINLETGEAKPAPEGTKIVVDHLRSRGMPESVITKLEGNATTDVTFLTAEDFEGTDVIFIDPAEQSWSTRIWKSIFGD